MWMKCEFVEEVLSTYNALKSIPYYVLDATRRDRLCLCMQAEGA